MDATTLWKQFNITQAELEAIHKAQHEKCAVCNRPLELGKASVCVDHNHLTGVVRGLLCWLCNRALGLLGDDIERLRAAIRYFTAPPAVDVIGARPGHLGRVTKKHGKTRRKDFYKRWDDVVGGVVYSCGCRDCSARPAKKCPVHGQPDEGVCGVV